MDPLIFDEMSDIVRKKTVDTHIWYLRDDTAQRGLGEGRLQNSWRIKAKNAKPKLGAGCTATVGMAVFLGAKAQPRETFRMILAQKRR